MAGRLPPLWGRRKQYVPTPDSLSSTQTAASPVSVRGRLSHARGVISIGPPVSGRFSFTPPPNLIGSSSFPVLTERNMQKGKLDLCQGHSWPFKRKIQRVNCSGPVASKIGRYVLGNLFWPANSRGTEVLWVQQDVSGKIWILRYLLDIWESQKIFLEVQEKAQMMRYEHSELSF